MAVIDYVCEIRAHFIDSTDRRTLYLEGSSWLLHEAFCLFGEADKFKPYEKHHSTVKEACQLAENLGIPNLLLYHTEETHLRERKNYIPKRAPDIIMGISMYLTIWKPLICRYTGVHTLIQESIRHIG